MASACSREPGGKNNFEGVLFGSANKSISMDGTWFVLIEDGFQGIIHIGAVERRDFREIKLDCTKVDASEKTSVGLVVSFKGLVDNLKRFLVMDLAAESAYDNLEGMLGCLEGVVAVGKGGNSSCE
jgi:hypothetical protein